MKTVVFLPKSEFTKEELKKLGPARFEEARLNNEDKVIAKCKGAEEVLLAISRTGPMSKKFFEKLPNLKYLGLVTTGHAWIDIEGAKKRKIPVTCCPGYSTEAVAEWTIWTMLSLARKNKIELQGKTLGIIGLGNIGKRMVSLGKGLGMKVIAWDRKKKKSYQVSLDKVLKESDFVSIHIALNKQTKNFLGTKEIAKMKKGAFLINSAREGLVDTKALARALKTKKLAGAAVDLDQHSKTKIPGAITTPHDAYRTAEAFSRGNKIFIDNLVAWRKGKRKNRVI